MNLPLRLSLELLTGVLLAQQPVSAPSGCSQFPLLWQGELQTDAWPQQWGMQSEKSWGQAQRRVFRQNGQPYPAWLRVYYPQGSASPAASRQQGAPKGGSQFLANLNLPPQDQLCLSYMVRFSDNFDFVQGGKLPGLYGGQAISGGRIPDGENGFSTRYMWRRQGAGELYAYLPSSRNYGTSFGRGNWQFRPGVWTKLEQWVRLNTPGQANGRVRVWVDGRLVLDQANLSFRQTNALKIEGLFFSTFFGGNDTSWATPRSVYADFANFQVRQPRR